MHLTFQKPVKRSLQGCIDFVLRNKETMRKFIKILP